jgi:hypothetical protein
VDIGHFRQLGVARMTSNQRRSYDRRRKLILLFWGRGFDSDYIALRLDLSELDVLRVIHADMNVRYRARLAA